jgi:hypothetical protein
MARVVSRLLQRPTLMQAGPIRQSAPEPLCMNRLRAGACRSGYRPGDGAPAAAGVVGCFENVAK